MSVHIRLAAAVVALAFGIAAVVVALLLVRTIVG